MRTTEGRYRAMLAVVGVIALAVLAGVVVLWPRGELALPSTAGQADSTRFVSATLAKVVRLDCEEADPGVPGSVCIKVTTRLAGGRQVTFDTTDPTGGMFRAGQRVRLAVTEQPGGQPLYYIQDLERGRPLLVLAALIAGAVVAFGRWQGVRSLVGLGLSFVVIISFVVPAILRGHSPVLVAVTGAMAIMLISLYLSHGTGPKTTAAVVGTALALGLTAALSIAFVAAASLTGLASEEAQFASFAVGGLSLRGLLLAGIIIGGLGVLDDVTMSQASLVTELHQANPTAGMAALLAGAPAGRARPHRGHRQHPVPGLCRGGAAVADPVRHRAGLPRHGGHHRAGGCRGRAGPLRLGPPVKGPAGRSGWALARGWARSRQHWCWTVSLPSTALTCRTPWSTSTAAAGWPPKSCRHRPGRPPPGSASWTPTPSGTHPGTSGPAPAVWSASTQPSLNRSGAHSRRPGSPAPHLSRGGSAPAGARTFHPVTTSHTVRPSAQLTRHGHSYPSQLPGHEFWTSELRVLCSRTPFCALSRWAWCPPWCPQDELNAGQPLHPPEVH